MKSVVLFSVLLTALSFTAQAQVKPNDQLKKNTEFIQVRAIAPTFSKNEQAEIKKILGKDYIPVFNEKGELSIATARSVKHVRALGGGFSKGTGSVANNILIHSGWVLATSKNVLDAMRSKLGAQRFQQLESIVSK